MPHDIRMHLPQTKQTNPNNFPPYEYRPYPRMMKDENGKPLRTPSGGYVIVNSAEEEAAFLGKSEPTQEARSVEIDTTEQPSSAPVISSIAPVVKRGPGRPPKLPETLT